jgi:hypothetical protein
MAIKSHGRGISAGWMWVVAGILIVVLFTALDSTVNFQRFGSPLKMSIYWRDGTMVIIHHQTTSAQTNAAELEKARVLFRALEKEGFVPVPEEERNTRPTFITFDVSTQTESGFFVQRTTPTDTKHRMIQNYAQALRFIQEENGRR